MSQKKISIVCGGPSSEYEVSLNSAQSILTYIDKEKYTPYIFYISKNGKALMYEAGEKIDIPKEKNLKNLLEETKKLKNMHMNILALHGEFGEDGIYQGILHFLDIPFTGCDSSSSSLCMDKYRSSLLAQENIDIKIPKTQFFKLEDILDKYKKFKKPICIKPNYKGSSVGVYLVHNQEDMDNALFDLQEEFDKDTPFIIQELIEQDTEVSCGCLQKKSGEFIKLPPIEIIPQSSKFFNYEAKYSKDGSIEITPPENISEALSDKISQLAIDIHTLLGCKVYSRSDFLIKGNNIYYLETNTLPGMTDTSLLPQEAKAAGISFTELIDFLIENS
jgi:D-alanine-D-alanine ligase